MNEIIYNDCKEVINNLNKLINKFENKKILITGYQGFLGSNFSAFFNILKKEHLKNIEVYCFDNNIVNLEDQTVSFTKDFKIFQGDNIGILPTNKFDYIIHCAGIASPIYYRKFPLETIDVNTIGYWKLLQSIDKKNLEALLYFSTSEIYGDPDSKHIPTNEDYRGNVSCTGPRACYDESKRLGETISLSFFQQMGMPIQIARPFNIYGPMMRLNDKRVIPDFVNYAITDGCIKLFSDGSPTRSFCYISDALEGFLRLLLIGEPAQPYNIGNSDEEISMIDLAKKISHIIGNVTVEHKISNDKNYLTDNPQRRCPVIKRANNDLNYYPKISLDEGLKRTINWYQQTYF